MARPGVPVGHQIPLLGRVERGPAAKRKIVTCFSDRIDERPVGSAEQCSESTIEVWPADAYLSHSRFKGHGTGSRVLFNSQRIAKRQTFRPFQKRLLRLPHCNGELTQIRRSRFDGLGPAHPARGEGTSLDTADRHLGLQVREGARNKRNGNRPKREPRPVAALGRAAVESRGEHGSLRPKGHRRTYPMERGRRFPQRVRLWHPLETVCQVQSISSLPDAEAARRATCSFQTRAACRERRGNGVDSKATARGQNMIECGDASIPPRDVRHQG